MAIAECFTQNQGSNSSEKSWIVSDRRPKFPGEQLEAIDNFVRALAQFPWLPRPEVFRLPDDVFRFEWQAQHMSLIVDPEPTGRCTVYLTDINGKDFEYESIGSQSPQMVEVLTRFTVGYVKLKADYECKSTAND